MRLSDFDYHLPDDLIATRPMSPRDHARMLVTLPDGRLENRHVYDMPQYLRAGDVMVFNDTRVIPARLMAYHGTRRIELLLHRMMDDGVWEVFAKPAKKITAGDELKIGDDFTAVVAGKNMETGMVHVRFNHDGAEFMQRLLQYGSMPVPPYFKRLGDARDHADYQTMFAKNDGAVAAPTAGLHFTPQLLDAIRGVGVNVVTITLHVGAGTFAPVRVDDIQDHIMHREWYNVGVEAASAIMAAKKRGGRVIGVGTTVARALESAANRNGGIDAACGDTQIFITPGYDFKLVDMMVTNFHLPQSTLLMMVAAFVGYDRMREIYANAIDQKYRFYSYGDACLLFKNHPSSAPVGTQSGH